MFTGCNSQNTSYETERFHQEINDFCDQIKEIDQSINSISNITMDESGLNTATETLMQNLDILKDEFIKFSNLDFPEEYDYLEQIADESADYMNEAVKAYHKAYEEKYTSSMEEYAQENYKRAYKRLQIIIDILNGKEPDTKID